MRDEIVRTITKDDYVKAAAITGRARVTRALTSMGRDKQSSLIDEPGQPELTCQFCDQVYRYSKDELEGPLAEM